MLDIYGKIKVTLMCDNCLKEVSTEFDCDDLMYESLESHINELMERYSFEDESICSNCWKGED